MPSVRKTLTPATFSNYGIVQEFGVLVSGVGEVEAGEWEAHAQLSGYRADAPQVRQAKSTILLCVYMCIYTQNLM